MNFPIQWVGLALLVLALAGLIFIKKMEDFEK